MPELRQFEILTSKCMANVHSDDARQQLITQTTHYCRTCDIALGTVPCFKLGDTKSQDS